MPPSVTRQAPGSQEVPSPQPSIGAAAAAAAVDKNNNKSKGLSKKAIQWLGQYIKPFIFAVVVVLSGLLITGCTTSSLSEIYIISISYQPSSFSAPDTGDNATVSAAFDIASNARSIQEVRVGYLGLCVRTSSGSWVCDTSTLNLVRALDDASQTDPLNLIWAGNQFQTEAVTSIFLFITFIFAFLNLILPILYTALGAIVAPKLEPLAKYLRKPLSMVYYVLYSIFSGVLVAYAAFQVAIWQHLSSAIFTSTTSALAFGAVACHTGVKGIALAWVGFVLAIVGMILFAIDKRRLSKSWLPSFSVPNHEPGPVNYDTNAEEEHEIHIDIPEPPPRPAPPPQQFPEMYRDILRVLAGQANRERAARRRNTTAWVHRTSRMQSGYAETIHDEDL
ncbi:Ca2+ regulator and membrane fusion protein Fig1-domain-containing protein [Rostrohypoxylon terebratum]|nr:Ca2+ regulator and membrane fusion protein Fig1-domain-containing protein [Rostrohypoxylon terebratum]